MQFVKKIEYNVNYEKKCRMIYMSDANELRTNSAMKQEMKRRWITKDFILLIFPLLAAEGTMEHASSAVVI